MTKSVKTKNRIRYSIIAFIALVIIGYSFYRVKDVMAGPDITLYSPINGESLKNPLVTIKGKAERITQLYLNGRKVFTDEKGNFTEPILIAKGYNLFEVKALDKFGREEVKKLELVLD